MTRLVRGGSGSASHLASSSRPLPLAIATCSSPARMAGNAWRTAAPGLLWFPRTKTCWSTPSTSVTAYAIAGLAGSDSSKRSNSWRNSCTRPRKSEGKIESNDRSGTENGPSPPSAPSSIADAVRVTSEKKRSEPGARLGLSGNSPTLSHASTSCRHFSSLSIHSKPLSRKRCWYCAATAARSVSAASSHSRRYRRRSSPGSKYSTHNLSTSQSSRSRSATATTSAPPL